MKQSPDHRAESDTSPSPVLLSQARVWEELCEHIRQDAASGSRLTQRADQWLDAPVLTVVDKKHPSPSGDPHDYVSMSAYWWPDESKPDGLPYVQRDGRVNPLFYEYDNVTLEALCAAVPHLTLQARVADSLPHARQAAKLLRGWFLDEPTRMNPHLRYAHFIPGVNDGRPLGIIDTTSLVFLLDAVAHLPFHDAWTPAHMAGLKAWFSSYLDWLLESPFGRDECARRNNHGTWYDAQVAAYALFCDRADVARQQIERFTIPRLASQIDPQGAQPHELRRTLSLTYCTYNLLAFACAGQVGKTLGIDLWSEADPGGGRLLRAMQWMEPFYAGREDWSHPQIEPFDFSSAALLLNLAWQGTADPRWARLARKLAHEPGQRILFSKAALTGRTYPVRTA